MINDHRLPLREVAFGQDLPSRFGDSVDPDQGYLILAVQPVGGI